MKPLQRVAFIGNQLPRRCGIATFTHDLHAAVAAARPTLNTSVVAMTDTGGDYDYPESVSCQVRDDQLADYAKAAAVLNAGRYDVVSLQHEYGIFGGEAGRHILELLARADMPIVTTLHTVLANPTPVQHSVLHRIIEASSKIVVMARKGKELLRDVHDVPEGKIEIIPHGIPDCPFRETTTAKAKLGFSGKSVILTFGLLSPSKGIETVIDAMPAIVASCPDAVYVVLGATHPNLVREQGEAYREALLARARELGIQDHVVFINQFVDQPTLLDFISMCDVYVTPYLNEAQMTSGTLAYSFGLGKAVVSTPYWHAKELLEDGLGIIVPFGNAKSVGVEIASLLTNADRREAIRRRAYAASRSMVWSETAERYISAFERVRGMEAPGRVPRVASVVAASKPRLLPELRTNHFLSMCDSTGLLQHAVHGVPDRSHGYCVDDNARALMLSSILCNQVDGRLPEVATIRFAAFVQHAWNPDKSRFRNFMSYDRRWLEDQGSEDSHGRTLWALGICAGGDRDASRRQWASELFFAALPVVEGFTSPRAWAFTLLGLDAICSDATPTVETRRVRGLLADRLLKSLLAVETNDWVWFEETLAYDNGRLPQALIVTGVATGDQSLVDGGLRSLRWLMTLQTASSGVFRPVGSESFGQRRQQPRPFDQQAVESAAAISACHAAWRTDRAATWVADASRAFDWFLGSNDLKTSLVDIETGSCRDGLHADRPNENRGAESVLSYLLSLVEIRQFERTANVERKHTQVAGARNIMGRAITSYVRPGGPLVSIPIPEPSGASSSPRPGPSRRQTVQAGDRAP